MFVSSSYSFKASCIHKLFFPSFQIECIYYSEKCFGSNLHENIAIISCCFFYVLCTEMRFASFLFGGFITAIVVNSTERKLAKCTCFMVLNEHPIFCKHFYVLTYSQGQYNVCNNLGSDVSHNVF